MSRAIAVDFLLSGLRDSNNEPLAGGLVYTYESGTTTAKSVYTDQGMVSAAANPVVLDSNGIALVFASGAYKFVIKDADGVTLYTWDNLQFVYPDDLPLFGGTSTGSGGAYVLTPSPALGALTDGLRVSFIANHQNAGAATLNISGLGAKAIKTTAGAALSGAEIASAALVEVIYVAASTAFRLLDDGLTIDDLGSIATQNANAVAITGGDISGLTTLGVNEGTWDPGAPVSDTGSVVGVSYESSYAFLGKYCFFSISGQLTITGTPGKISIALPANAITTRKQGGTLKLEGVRYIPGTWTIETATPGVLDMRVDDGVTFGSGTVYYQINAFYKTA